MRNGHIPTQALSFNWQTPPKKRWSTSCGFGHSSIITSGEFVITMEQVGENESLIARNLDDGTEAWKVTEPTRWHDMLSGTGPRSTPTLQNGKIYALFSNGRLYCIEASTGKIIWNIQTIRRL